MKRVTIVSAVAVAAVAVLAGAAASAPPRDTAMKRNPRGLPAVDGTVNFTSSCAFSHTNFDDPIVHPGIVGASHQHSFVGNDTTNADSTLASLQAGTTSCRRSADKAGYWMPTLFKDGAPVQPVGATIYYRRRTLQAVRPFPAGLKIVAGNSAATSPQDLRITYWNCGPLADVAPSSTVPTCPDSGPDGLRLHVRFPSCWDGRNLDSADHKSHMAYPTSRQGCPADHPVAVPELEVIFRYPTTGGANVVLASGGQFSGHADFFNAWDETVLTQLVGFCLDGGRHCGPFGP
jgi:hypothetical protein